MLYKFLIILLFLCFSYPAKFLSNSTINNTDINVFKKAKSVASHEKILYSFFKLMVGQDIRVLFGGSFTSNQRTSLSLFSGSAKKSFFNQGFSYNCAFVSFDLEEKFLRGLLINGTNFYKEKGFLFNKIVFSSITNSNDKISLDENVKFDYNLPQDLIIVSIGFINYLHKILKEKKDRIRFHRFNPMMQIYGDLFWTFSVNLNVMGTYHVKVIPGIKFKTTIIVMCEIFPSIREISEYNELATFYRFSLLFTFGKNMLACFIPLPQMGPQSKFSNDVVYGCLSAMYVYMA